MNVRFKQRWGSISVLTLLSVTLAACGGGNGGTGSGAASPSTAGSTGASPAAPSASTGGGGASASASTGGGASASASAGGGGASTSASASGSAAAPAGSGAAASCPANAQGQQITMWSPLTGGDGGVMTQLAQQFSQSSGVTVSHVPQPEYLQKLETAAAGQTLPDMTVIRASDIAQMAARNITKPMSADALTAAGGESIAAQFPEQVWNIGEYNDARYAVPLDVHPLVLYYNKDLVSAAGVTIPTDRPMTREEFDSAVDTLNKDGVAGIAVGTLFSGETMFEMLLRQFGGQVANEDGTEATYNSEAGVQALTYIRDLKQKTSPDISGQGDPEVTQFQQGKAAMVIHGPWHIGNLSKLPFTGYAQVPQIGDQYAVQGGSHQLALTTEDPAKQAAAGCWIGWLSANSAQWATAGQVPAREDARANLESVAPPVAAFAEEIEQVIMPQPLPGFSGAIGGAEGFGRAVNPVLLGEQTDIKAALDEAAQRSTQLLQQNAQQYQ